MEGTQLRLSGPGIASVIFAPAPANYTPSSVTTSGGLADTLPFEWPTDEEKERFWYALRTRRCDLAEVQRLFSALLGHSNGQCASRLPDFRDFSRANPGRPKYIY